MQRRISRALALSSAALAGVLVLAACGNDDMDHGSSPTTGASTGASSGASAPSGSYNDRDVMFAQMMIPHHEQAVDMAKVVLGKTTNAEIRKLAAAIEAAQAPEIAQLKAMLTAWGRPTAAPGGMNHGADGMMAEADMQAFRAASGTELDRKFLEMMVVHHKGAITMAETELAQGTNPEARKLAEAVKSTQALEIQQMQQLLTGTPAGTPATPGTPGTQPAAGTPTPSATSGSSGSGHGGH